MQANLTAVEDGARRQEPRYTFRASSRDDLTPTKQQLRVLELLSRGLSVHQAADEMGIGYQTAKTHLQHVRSTLGAKTKTHAVAEAIRMGLFP